MNPSRSLVGAEFSRNSPLGGEVTESATDLKRRDGPSRFRQNFDCCHQVPLEGCSQEKWAGHMTPNVDLSVIGDMKTYRTSSKEREITPAVLRLDVAPRRDDRGNFNFEQQTRETSDQLRRKSCCTSRHSIFHHENHGADNLANSRSLCEARKPKRVRFADDIGYNLETKPTSRQDYEIITNPENWPIFENEADCEGPEVFCTYFGNRDNATSAVPSYNYKSTLPSPSIRMHDNNQGIDRNQNHHVPLDSIFSNYHSPLQEGFATAEKDVTSCAVRKHSHSMIPTKVMSGMKIIKGEMKQMVAKFPRIPKTLSMSHLSDVRRTISGTSNMSENSGKSDLQKRYMEGPPEPGVRNHTQ